MSDDEFTEHLHLTGSSSNKEQQRGRTIGSQKGEGKKEESEDDSEELGPSPPSRPTIVRPGQGTPGPETARKRYPKTPKPKSQQQLTLPLTRAQSAKRKAAQHQQTRSQTPSPPQTRAQSAKQRAAHKDQSQTPRAARLNPGLTPQPRVVLSPIDTTATPGRNRGTHTHTPIPSDMANYYRNYWSPGRGRSWGPTNKHPPNHPYTRIPRSTATSNLADGREPLPRTTRSGPWIPPRYNPNPNTATPPQLHSLPDVSMESLSGLDAFHPQHYDEPLILEGDAPSHPRRHPQTTRRPRPSTRTTHPTQRKTQIMTTCDLSHRLCITQLSILTAFSLLAAILKLWGHTYDDEHTESFTDFSRQ